MKLILKTTIDVTEQNKAITHTEIYERLSNEFPAVLVEESWDYDDVRYHSLSTAKEAAQLKS